MADVPIPPMPSMSTEMKTLRGSWASAGAATHGKSGLEGDGDGKACSEP